jgi:hypothetical protein
MAVAALGIAAYPPTPAAATGSDAAQAAYHEAQALKRSNRFAEARGAFQEVADLADAPQWSTLAADELRYGLPLHESNVLLAELTRATDHPTRSRLLARIDALYQTMLDGNVDNPERIGEIERRRDQLALLRQSARGHEHSSLSAGLDDLRHRIEHYHDQHGHWPDRRRLETEIANMLGDAGLASDRVYLFDFYPSSTSFFATLRDNQGGPDIKLKGDGGRVRVEGGGR